MKNKNLYRCSLIEPDDFQEKLDAFCALPPNRVETIRTGEEATIVPFNASPTATVAVTIFVRDFNCLQPTLERRNISKTFQDLIDYSGNVRGMRVKLFIPNLCSVKCASFYIYNLSMPC